MSQIAQHQPDLNSEIYNYNCSLTGKSYQKSHTIIHQNVLWEFYKTCFHVDRVILIGDSNEYRAVYFLDKKSRKSLQIRLSIKPLEFKMRIIGIDRISFKNLRTNISVNDAISLLENCKSDRKLLPELRCFYSELLSYLNKE